jgi:hypothetical protein
MTDGQDDDEQSSIADDARELVLAGGEEVVRWVHGPQADEALILGDMRLRFRRPAEAA